MGPRSSGEGGSGSEGRGPERVAFSPSSSVWDDMAVLRAMWFGRIKGGTHQDQLESFYERQAHLYDQYRHRMLHGRAPMLMAMPVETKGQVWVDLGGGTAANLEAFAKSIDWFDQIVVVDLTPSLVGVAKQRVQRNGWQGRVRVVLGDATDPNLEGLPAAGTADLVSISYALTMIPEWSKAVANAKRLLKPGGRICVCDFTVDEGQFAVSRAFWTKLFRQDHIHLSAEHLRVLQSEFEQEQLEIRYGGFPYVPLLKCPYYHFIGAKPKE